MKEISKLAEFVLIAFLAGIGFYGLVIFRDPLSGEMLGETYWPLLANWILVFLVLGIIKAAITHLASRGKEYSDQNRKRSPVWEEAARTLQYSAIAIISVIASFYVWLLQFPAHIHVNQREAWSSFNGMFAAWIVGFLILSLLRMGIYYGWKRK